jgi:hypothetical protein
MREISIGDNHKAYIARQQHVLEWLQQERARLEHDLMHVIESGARVQNEVLAFIGQTYGVSGSPHLTIDSERGVILVPDEPAAPAAPVPSTPAPTPTPTPVPVPVPPGEGRDSPIRRLPTRR